MLSSKQKLLIITASLAILTPTGVYLFYTILPFSQEPSQPSLSIPSSITSTITTYVTTTKITTQVSTAKTSTTLIKNETTYVTTTITKTITLVEQIPLVSNMIQSRYGYFLNSTDAKVVAIDKYLYGESIYSPLYFVEKWSITLELVSKDIPKEFRGQKVVVTFAITDTLKPIFEKSLKIGTVLEMSGKYYSATEYEKNRIADLKIVLVLDKQ